MLKRRRRERGKDEPLIPIFRRLRKELVAKRASLGRKHQNPTGMPLEIYNSQNRYFQIK
jgi:hypothetical protein